jgi:hypothetical protein
MVTISVYLDNGNVCQYDVYDEAKAREHAAAIVSTGYRSVNKEAENVMTWIPPHRIQKVVVNLDGPSNTRYRDTTVST